MATIQTDQELKRLLENLNPEQQRHVGGLFIESALDLCSDARIQRAVKVAVDAEADDDIREDAFHTAKAYAVSTYTECGRDTDWTRQAAHFIGVAAACLLSEEEPTGGSGSRAWRVAMQVRNARNCALIAHEGDINDEADNQRRIANEFTSE